jgi:hypothetical protein
MKSLTICSRFFYAVLALSACVVEAAKLGDYLKLPEYFSRGYRNWGLKIERDPRTRVATFALTEYKRQPPRANVEIVVDHKLVVSLPSAWSESQVRNAVAQSFLRQMEMSDVHYRNATYYLEQMGSLGADKKIVSLSLTDRVRSVGAAILSQTPVPQDEVAGLWWRLKFSPENLEAPTFLQKGDPVLLVAKQYDYIEWDPSFLTRLRRKLDFGHSVLGLRYLGQDATEDLLFNPGSKDYDLSEVTLPNSPQPNVPNMVDVDSFWKWSEVQLHARYLKVAVRVFPLNALQAFAVRRLAPGVRGLSFGLAATFSNNCADGSARMINFILPVGQSFKAAGFFGAATPQGILRQSSKGFSKKLKVAVFEFPNIAEQNPSRDTPPISYKKVSYPDLNKLYSFKDFREWETRWINEFNSR